MKAASHHSTTIWNAAASATTVDNTSSDIVLSRGVADSGSDCSFSCSSRRLIPSSVISSSEIQLRFDMRKETGLSAPTHSLDKILGPSTQNGRGEFLALLLFNDGSDLRLQGDAKKDRKHLSRNTILRVIFWITQRHTMRKRQEESQLRAKQGR